MVFKMEREYIVPLRREFQKVPKHRRTNRAMKALRDFISRHMKSDNISIGKFLNMELWARGMRNPPHKVAVKAIKDSDGKVTVELKNLPIQREKVNKRLARVEKSEGKKTQDSEKEPKKSSKDKESEDKKELKVEKSDSKKVEPKKIESKEAESKKKNPVEDKKETPKKEEKAEHSKESRKTASDKKE